MVTFVFTKKSERLFGKLPEKIQIRIMNKLTELKEHPDIFSILKKLCALEPATHRLRIGSYRLILEQQCSGEESMEFWILDIGHRSDIYK